MKSTKIALLAGILCSASLSATAYAGSCKSIQDKFNQVYGSVVQNHCVNLDLGTSLDNNPFIYTNPDAGCDLGLQLPGLPDFGISAGGINACSIAKAITGPMVDKVNQAMRAQVNSVVSSIDEASVNAIGTQASGGIDVGDVIQEQYNQMSNN